MHQFTNPSLIVSLHDVSPLTFAASCSILQDLETVGIGKLSLLVIPHHHHRAHFLQDAAFCDWLRAMAEKGHEIVTHGYFHQRERSAKDSIYDQMITRFYTADEGEFYDISEAQAWEKMQRAQSEFASLGLQPVGFIAPAWLLSPAGERAAGKIGFRYTTTLTQIRCLAGIEGDLPQRHTTQSLVYSVRSAWRRVASIAWNRSLLSRLASNPVVRLGIHPPDWEFPAIRREILHLARHLTAGRQVATYAEWTAP